MTIGSYPIGSAPIGGEPPVSEGLPEFPPPLTVTTWDPAASGPGMTLANGNRLASGNQTAISTSSQNIDYVGEIVAEIDTTMDVGAAPTAIYFGLATSAANTSQLPGSDTNGWAVKIDYIGQIGDESAFELFYRHNGVENFVGQYNINNEFADPQIFYVVIKVGNGNLQLDVGTDQDETFPLGPVVNINTGTDNLQAGDQLFITFGFADDFGYLNGDNPAGFINADDLYPGAIHWDGVGGAGVVLLAGLDIPLTFAPPVSQTLLLPLVNAFGQVIDLDLPFAPYIGNTLALRLPMFTDQRIDLPLGDGVPLAQTLDLPLDFGNQPVSQTLVLPLTQLVHQTLTLPLGDSTPLAQTLVLPLRFGSKLAQILDVPLLQAFGNPVRNELRIPLPILGEPPVLVGDAAVVTIGGKRVEILSAEVRSDNGSPYWQASITLASPQDYGRFTPDAPFLLDLYGTQYNLIVDTRQLSRQVAPNGQPQDRASITGLSPVATYGTPRAAAISQTWTEAVSAQNAVQDLLEQSVDWQILDWMIPAFRLAIQNGAPLDAARQVVEAVGGALLSNADGTLVAVQANPIKPADYETAPVVLTLHETDIYTTAEQIAAVNVVDEQRVVDVESYFSDRLEFAPDADNPLRGIARAYPAPWTEDVVIKDSAGAVVRVYDPFIETRQETETIEITAGRGSVRYPITQIDSAEYVYDDLGGISFIPGAQELYTSGDGYSLLTLTYTTRAIAANVESFATTRAQLLLERNT